MNRALACFNLFGVATLAVLCVVQWRANRQVNLEVNRLEEIRIQQSGRLNERDKTLQNYTNDLASLREHLSRLAGELKEARDQLTATERQTGQLTAERELLKEGVARWAEAVAARDERLRVVVEQLQALAAERGDVVARFNELAGKHNQAVRDLDERTRQFNELVTKYNEAVKGKAPPAK